MKNPIANAALVGVFIVFCLRITANDGSGPPKPCTEQSQAVAVMLAQFNSGAQAAAVATWESIVKTPCWRTEHELQISAARAVLQTIKADDFATPFDFAYFTFSEANEALFTGLLQRGCYNVLLVDGLGLLDRIAPDERANSVRELHFDLSRGKFPAIISSTKTPSSTYVCRAMAVYPYPGACEDMWKLFLAEPREELLQDYIALCFKEHRRISLEELRQILAADATHGFRSSTTYSYLFALAADKVGARRLIQEHSPNLPSGTYSSANVSAINKWVAANYKSIEIH